MMPKSGNSFGREIIQTLLDNVTTSEFQGRIIVILGGYKHDIEELFSINPGFQSRFDKRRIEFKEWTGQQASSAIVKAIERDGKCITASAVAIMNEKFEIMRNLPNWASARDAFDIVYKQMEQKRATEGGVGMKIPKKSCSDRTVEVISLSLQV